MSIFIEKFSRKRPFKRRQYHARIVVPNVFGEDEIIWWTEGYNHARDRDRAIYLLENLGNKAIIHDMDDPQSVRDPEL